MKNVLLTLDVTFFWNNEPDTQHTKECYVGIYNEDTPDIDSFYWFRSVKEILGEHGDFTVTTYKITDSHDNKLLKKLEEYDDYMTTKVENEGYNLPISLQEFLALQVNPVALSELNLTRNKDVRFFERFKDLYLKHSVDCMDATEIRNVPVCYNEWEEYEGQGAAS